MARTVIKGGAVLTLDPSAPFHADGAVVIDGDRIAWTGPASELVPEPGDRIVDASRKVVMPGLVNLHYHVDLGRATGEFTAESDRRPMWDTLFDDWYPFIGQLRPDEVYWASMACYAEAIRFGNTSVNDMYVQTEARARAAGGVGIRATLSNEIATPETGIDTIQDNIDAFKAAHGTQNGLVKVAFGIEWLPCASDAILSDVRAAATELGAGIHIHLNEAMSEVENSLARFGKRPTELAYELGFLGPDVVAAHCVHLDDREIQMVAETGAHISHNPASNSFLGNGVARMNDFRAAGINVGMGTDASFMQDMFEAMRWSTYLHRATAADISVRSSYEALEMATVNGSKALGQDTGTLAAGMLADLILLDVDQMKFAMMDATDFGSVASFVTNHANGNDVASTMVAGEFVMLNGELTRVDEREIKANLRSSMAAAFSRA
ncbi:amidohydrolase [Demequina capsici]|uniref:Amidohydrolase n=1 Tax=Demequina capsici TaxID=3075620 RepID=A0AA96J9Z8_9MICO|nr:amidohydrolase [Demequina sp. PMTSA13]WNM26910.1 amidohydrolase [Demequina sp. PMTSA13]